MDDKTSMAYWVSNFEISFETQCFFVVTYLLLFYRMMNADSARATTAPAAATLFGVGCAIITPVTIVASAITLGYGLATSNVGSMLSFYFERKNCK